MKLEISLNQREAKALMQETGRGWDKTGEVTLDWPNGVRKSQARASAEFKVIDAIVRAREAVASQEPLPNGGTDAPTP